MGAKLAYTPEFKQFIRQNPGVIGKFIQAYKNKAEECNFGDVSIAEIKDAVSHELGGSHHKKLWKVTVSDRAFFVKETHVTAYDRAGSHDGYGQFTVLQELSSQTDSRNIEVATGHLGFTGEKTGFLVMDFYDLPIFASVRGRVTRFAHVRARLTRLSKMLTELSRDMRNNLRIFDIAPDHAFYDALRKKLILFDPGRGKPS